MGVSVVEANRHAGLELLQPMPCRSLSLPSDLQSLIDKMNPPANLRLSWYPRPHDDEPEGPVRFGLLEGAGKTDARGVVSDLLGISTLDGAVSSIDLQDGCRNNCDCCLRGVRFPRRKFTTGSMMELLADRSFQAMLNREIIDVGSFSDCGDNKDSPLIIRKLLQVTKGFDDHLVENHDTRHYIRAFMSFRKNKVDVLEGLIRLAKEEPRLEVIISLPMNVNPTVKRQFVDFAAAHSDVFHGIRLNGGVIEGESKLDNVRVFDPQANRIILSGRQMSQEHMVEMRKNEVHDGWGLLHLAQYGAAYCNLNPQGLWIGVKVTPGDSDTRELHCRLTPNNVGCLQGLKRVKNYLPLTNWRGGSFETPDLEEISLLSKRRNDRTS